MSVITEQNHQPPTPKQVTMLTIFKYPAREIAKLDHQQARQLISSIARNGWRPVK